MFSKNVANPLVELKVRGERSEEQVRSLLAPYGLVKEMKVGEGEEEEGGAFCLDVTILTTPEAALSACKGTSQPSGSVLICYQGFGGSFFKI